MNFPKQVYFGIVFLLFIMSPVLNAREIAVKNVQFEDRGESIVVRYDLDGQVGKKYKVSIYLSDDKGNTFHIKPKTVVGDAGKNITAGLGKQITWYLKEDFPDGLSGSGFVFAVDAELQKSGKKWPYIVGASVVGSVVYFVTKGKKDVDKKITGSIVIDIPGNI